MKAIDDEGGSRRCNSGLREEKFLLAHPQAKPATCKQCEYAPSRKTGAIERVRLCSWCYDPAERDGIRQFGGG